jgi:ABC-2 type transport system ATP-binding protein
MHSPLTIKDLHKTYKKAYQKKTIALKKESLEVKQGQIFGFIGPNGAGKSTAIKITMGLIRADSGIARIFGEDVSRVNARTKVGFVPELPNLYDHLTGEEFLSFSGNLSGIPQRILKEKSSVLLSKVGLLEAKDQRLRTYSKGMQQRLIIAQSLVNDPELIIMDEPLSGLDPIGRMEIQELIQGLQSEGKTIFFSSHILHDVETICDQVALLINGEIHSIGTPDNIENTFKNLI